MKLPMGHTLISLAAAAVLSVSGCAPKTPPGGAAQPPAPGGEAQPAPGANAPAPGATTPAPVAPAPPEAQLTHIHGLGYSADGSRLLVPAHDGFRIYADGKWQQPDVPAHDYMGFNATDDGFYSSGHPAPGSGIANPVGLVKSTDGGKTLIKLRFEGEADFHVLGVGYTNHAIYLLNPRTTPVLRQGMHYSLDSGKTWKQCATKEIETEPLQIAVHPTKANVVAVGTERGVFLSTDHGELFERIGDGKPNMAVAFSPAGDTLLFGLQSLSAYDLSSKQVRAVTSPAIGSKDAIAYVAVNPVRKDEIAVATLARDVNLTRDGGKTWTQIAQQGQGR